MNLAVQRLNEGLRATIVAHFLALPMKDRALRFGMSLTSTALAAYVDGIDFDQDAVFGVRDDWLSLAGVAHVAFEDDLAELGLSVLPAHRTRGVGSALFKRAVAHARKRRVPRLLMHCVSANTPIMRIAQRFGMDIVSCGGNADAYLELRLADLAPIGAEADAPIEDVPADHPSAR